MPNSFDFACVAVYGDVWCFKVVFLDFEEVAKFYVSVSFGDGVRGTEGNRNLKLGDLFEIQEDNLETPYITINGDAGKVKRIGSAMKTGEILINGDAGMHTGEKMAGGKITVNGNIGGWSGNDMKGGLIEVHGDAGDYLASPYRGTSTGMKGGVIIIDGRVGSDSGCYLHGGVLKIKGGAGRFLGYHMSDGVSSLIRKLISALVHV